MHLGGWRAIPRAFILVSMAAALGACGGGGGGGGGGDATTYTVSASATGSGSVSPASQPVDAGATATITVTPDTGYLISSVSGCDGTLSGNTYTTGAITADCTVSAVFSQTPSTTTHTVNATATGSGSVSPNAQQVNEGATATVTVTPDAGYLITSVTGCDGALDGNTYTTAAVTADCTVSAVFSQPPGTAAHNVSATAAAGGSVSPASQQVDEGGTTAFTLTAEPGYHIDSVTGCGGTLSGTTYTTGAVTGDCTVSATFAVDAYTADFYRSAANFTAVKPGLGYACSLNHDGTTKTNVILNKVHLPPDEAAPRMGAALVVDQTDWVANIADSSLLYRGTVSCDIDRVQDASGNDHLIVAYDHVYLPFTRPVRSVAFAVIPLNADGSLTDASQWSYRRYDDATQNVYISVFAPQVHLGVVGNAIHMAYTAWDTNSREHVETLYFADLPAMLAGTFTRQWPGAQDCEYTQVGSNGTVITACPCGLVLPGTLDAAVENGKFVVTTLNYFTSWAQSHGATRLTLDGVNYTLYQDENNSTVAIGARSDANAYTDPADPANVTFLANQFFANYNYVQVAGSSYANLLGTIDGWWAGEHFNYTGTEAAVTLPQANRQPVGWDAIVQGDTYLMVQRSAAGGFVITTGPASATVNLSVADEYVGRWWPYNLYAKITGAPIPADDLPPYYDNTECVWDLSTGASWPGEIHNCNDLLKMYHYQPEAGGAESLLLMYTNAEQMLTFREVPLPLATIPDTSYLLTYIAWENGTIEGDTTQVIASGGSGTAVTAVPDAGYHFVEWTDHSTQNPRTDTNITADRPLAAYFAPDR